MYPELLKTISGVKVDNIEDWNIFRREEILNLFTNFVYGKRLIKRPNNQHYKTDKIIKLLDGKVVYKNVNIKFTGINGAYYFPIHIFLPKQVKRPIPSFVYIMHEYQSAKFDINKELNYSFLPIEKITNMGYALIVYETKHITPNNDNYLKQGMLTAIETESLRDDSFGGIISSWAWAASRVMDYIETDNNLDENKVGLVGHSRGGKTALWAGANDTRFALVVSNNSGCTGAALSRNKKGETVKLINDNFPNWFCKNYHKFADKEELLPIEQHMLLALIAPRPLYVSSSSQDEWADPQSECRACKLASEIYELYGEKGLILEGEPSINNAYQDGKIAYHNKEGEHSISEFDWELFIKFANKNFEYKK